MFLSLPVLPVDFLSPLPLPRDISSSDRSCRPMSSPRHSPNSPLTICFCQGLSSLPVVLPFLSVPFIVSQFYVEATSCFLFLRALTFDWTAIGFSFTWSFIFSLRSCPRDTAPPSVWLLFARGLHQDRLSIDDLIHAHLVFFVPRTRF